MPELKNSLNGETVFDTERIIGRRWLDSDFDKILEVYSDPEVSRWIDDGSPITQEEARSWLNVTAKNYSARGYGMFALVDRKSDDVAGFIGLVHPGGQTQPEVKYAFSKPYWGRGLATEVVQALIDHANVHLNLTMIVATVAPENIASQRVLEKVGFNFVSTRKDEHGSSEFYYERHW